MSTYAAAPACCRMLAEWGADVVKVESFAGDIYRYFGLVLKAVAREDENAIFEVDNAYKRGVCIDLKNPDGREVMARLLESADVLVTNLRARALENLGLTYEALAARYPRLVYGYINGYGDKGPIADRPGFDLTAYWARGGIMGNLGEPDAPPLSAAAGFGDHPSGLFLAGGIAAALVGRERTGKGDKVEVALYHAAIWNMGLNLAAGYYWDHVPKISRKDPVNPLVNPYRCRDGEWICLSILEHPRYWPVFCGTIGREDLIEDPRFSNVVAAQENSAALVAILDDEIAKRDRAEWEELWSEADITFENVQMLDDILVDEQAFANDFIIEVEYESGGKSILPTTPIRMGSTSGQEFRHAPRLGQHTREVLAELGYAEEEVEGLIKRQAVKAG